MYIQFTLATYKSCDKGLPIKPVCNESVAVCKERSVMPHLCCTIAHVKQSPNTLGMERHRSSSQSRAKMMPMSAKYASKCAACKANEVAEQQPTKHLPSPGVAQGILFT